jgi:hypothetical protein
MFAVPGLTKLIFLIAIICAVWYGFRLLGAVDRARRQAERMSKQTPRQQRRADVANVEDTVKCRVCGAYVPARQPTRCNRSDCPF